MTNLLIEETSGVDHPAHLHEGWLVIKASDTTTVAEVERSLPEPMEASMSEATEEIVDQEPVLAADESAEEQAKEEHDEDELAVANARIMELEARIAEMEAMMEEPVEEASDDVVALAKAAPEPLRKAIEEMQKAKEAAETALSKESEDRADSEAITKARETFKHLNIDAEKIGPGLRRLAEIDEDLAKAIEGALESADAQNESADIFTEVGKGYVPSGDAIERMSSLAKAAVAEGKAGTIEQALAQVAVENPSLYNDYLTEKGA
jgi:DNA repair exonuclease SbcCD ATPase subunit